MRIFVTGVAGFIGFHVSLRLLARGDTVIGIDNVNSYYDVRLKEARFAILADHDRFQFHHIDLADGPPLEELCVHETPRRGLCLAPHGEAGRLSTSPHG